MLTAELKLNNKQNNVNILLYLFDVQAVVF